MILKHLENELDRIFGPFSEEKTAILNAAKKDINAMTSIASGDDVLKILNIFQEMMAFFLHTCMQ
jgi:vacuolar-type H+-ATPase subunit H